MRLNKIMASDSRLLKLSDKRFLITLSILIVAWGLVYKDALVAMEAIWARSDTFAHGYFILPISLWLLWRDKEKLLKSNTQVSWLPLPLLAISLFVGLFAYAADINVLGQLSAVCSLILILWMLAGDKLAWRYKFPLAYLLFSVPMGDNLIPWLQDITAWFTVYFLRLTGIPVYVEGLYIQIPTGMFEVAVACSGIRYLIASAAVGSLYSYLTYQKTHKQIMFFMFSLVLPILANGIRAYGIVAIAYYSDMEYATGTDHLVYGWLFFGLIIMLMFWIGSFFADDIDNKDKVSVRDSDKPAVSLHHSTALALTLTLLATAFYLVQTIPTVQSVNVLPIEQKRIDVSKQYEKVKNSSWGINFTAAIQQTLEKDAAGVEVFRAVYANKQSQGEMISWTNITHDHNKWTIVSTKEILLEGKPSMLVHMRSINGQPRSYLYHYKVGSFYTINENKAKLMQAWNSLSRQSDFSEIRAVSLAGEVDYDKVEQQLTQKFSQITFPYIALNYSVEKGA